MAGAGERVEGSGTGSVLSADMPAESFLHRTPGGEFAGKIGAGKAVSHPFLIGTGRNRTERVFLWDAPYPGAGAGAVGHLRADFAGDAADTDLHEISSAGPPLNLTISSGAARSGSGDYPLRSYFRTISFSLRPFTVGLSITFPSAS